MGKIADSTLTLRENLDSFLADFEAEYRTQATKENRSSERRMRALLRKFSERVYVPYRESTLKREAEEAANAEVPF